MYSCLYCFTAKVTRTCPTCNGVLGLCRRCLAEVGHDYCPRCDSPNDPLADPVPTSPAPLDEADAVLAPV